MHSTSKSSCLLSRLAIGLLVLVTASLNAVHAATLSFEDLWPGDSDKDFNDQVLQYNFAGTVNTFGQFTDLHASVSVLAIGSSIHNGVYLHLPVPTPLFSSATLDIGQGPGTVSAEAGESQLVVQLVADTRQLYGPNTGFINTDPSLPRVPVAPPMQLDIHFATPVTLDLSQAPFDLFIARTGDRSHEIHLPQYGGTAHMNTSLFNTGVDASTPGRHFIDQKGLPFALDVPSIAIPPSDPNLAVWPKESVPIDLVYPQIVSFAASGGTAATDWYNFPNTQYLYAVPEPSTFVLGGLGLVGLIAAARRRQASVIRR